MLTPTIAEGIQILTGVAALLAALGSLRNHRSISTLKVEIDGRLTQLLEKTDTAGELRGHAAGVAAERGRRD